MNPQSTDDNVLEHKFRVEDNTVEILLDKLEAANVKPERLGKIAEKVLEIATEALSRPQLADLLQQAATQFPELKEVSIQEELYVKEEAEKIIKQAVDELIEQNKVDEALALSKTINQGQIPPEIQEKINQI